MTQGTNRTGVFHAHRRTGILIAAALAASPLGLTSCGVVNAAKTAVHNVEGNKATIDAFTSKVQSGEASTFEATYMTTGSSPATVVYAVQPPNKLSFTITPSGGASGSSPATDLIVNSSGEYACLPPSGSTTTWSCQTLAPGSSAAQNQILDFYTPSHWITFLKDFSLAAGIAGDRVTSSTMTVNGFNMQCVDFVAPGVTGTSTICTTPQNILGYVKVASDSTSFEITNYSASPPASLFETPAGATITPVQSGTSTPVPSATS